MLELVIGEKTNPLAADELIDVLTNIDINGTLYIGYPIIASPDEPILIDALLTTLEHGVVLIDFEGYTDGISPDQMRERQDDLYTALFQKLLGVRSLRTGRELSIEVKVVTLRPPGTIPSGDKELIATTSDKVPSLLKRFPSIKRDQLKALNSAIQRVATIKPIRKRLSVTRNGSKGGILRNMEKEIANLDQWQKHAAVELPNGPQRIRGLAGSGKTIVLALKAAYLHARNPNWQIAITFQTRSLYQQFRDLIRRFTFEHLSDEPDWEQLHILHAWGSRQQPGVYSEIAKRNGIDPKNFLEARQSYGYDAAFDGACRELATELEKKSSPEMIYDALLIDEAQDLPHSFFEVAYLSTKQPKRIVWAYDELQNLGVYAMSPPSELFGKDSTGRPRVAELRNDLGQPKQDIVLPICYRNTPWALTIAHALGFGIYRAGGLVQFFDDPDLWTEIGYNIISGEIAPGRDVILKRRPDSYPDFFDKLLNSADAVQCKVFKNVTEQADWVADQINKNILEDELTLRDILVILANPFTGQKDAGRVMRALEHYELASHLAGITSSVDELFTDDSIATSGIYRAKGNEAAMVYILNSEYGLEGSELIKRRNVLFTGITRSRAWVRLCGCGSSMSKLKAEVDRVVDEDYKLRIRVPTAQQLQHLRRIHRDMTAEEISRTRQVEKGLSEFVEMIDRGELSLDNLPSELRDRLLKITKKGHASDT